MRMLCVSVKCVCEPARLKGLPSHSRQSCPHVMGLEWKRRGQEFTVTVHISVSSELLQTPVLVFMLLCSCRTFKEEKVLFLFKFQHKRPFF